MGVKFCSFLDREDTHLDQWTEENPVGGCSRDGRPWHGQCGVGVSFVANIDQGQQNFIVFYLILCIAGQPNLSVQHTVRPQPHPIQIAVSSAVLEPQQHNSQTPRLSLNSKFQ